MLKLSFDVSCTLFILAGMNNNNLLLVSFRRGIEINRKETFAFYNIEKVLTTNYYCSSQQEWKKCY